MQDIKLYQDGSRLILVFENPNADIAKVVQAMVGGAKAENVELEPMPKQKAEPAPKLEKCNEIKGEKQFKNSVKLPSPYSGLNIDDAIAKDGINACQTLYAYAAEQKKARNKAHAPSEDIDNIIKSVLKYLDTDIKRYPSTYKTDAIAYKFLTNYQEFMKADVETILSQSGYYNSGFKTSINQAIKNFVFNEPETEVQEAYQMLYANTLSRIEKFLAR